jgi:integrase/recombinase XerC
MARKRITRKFTAQLTSCSSCGEPFPVPMEKWPGHWDLYCDKPECVAVAKEHPHRRNVNANELKCTAPGCTRYIPAGTYSTRKGQYVCSIDCWYTLRCSGGIPFECGYCGKTGFRRHDESICGLHFCSREHYGLHLTEKSFQKVGSFRPMLERYFETFVTTRYRGKSIPSHRTAVFTLLGYLTEVGISSLDEVDPSTITAYLLWAKKQGRARVATDTSHVRMFFDWAQVAGLRKGDNPVVPSIHSQKRAHRLPRPFSDKELDYIWQLLEARGNSRLRAIAAVAEEAGVRLGEIARLRVEDVDLKTCRLFIRLPNKTNTERYAFFGDKTRMYIKLWLEERYVSCGHNSLFHNQWGEPCSEQQIHMEFSSTLCKTYCGKKFHEEGLDSWSIHRLRHTMATRLAKGGANTTTIMGAGGWTSASAMAGYTKIDPEDARRGYDEAMRRASMAKDVGSIKQTLSLSEFLNLSNKPD